MPITISPSRAQLMLDGHVDTVVHSASDVFRQIDIALALRADPPDVARQRFIDRGLPEARRYLYAAHEQAADGTQVLFDVSKAVPPPYRSAVKVVQSHLDAVQRETSYALSSSDLAKVWNHTLEARAAAYEALTAAFALRQDVAADRAR